MPRIRTIKPEIWSDELLGELPAEARLLFIGLITQADDEGKLRGNPVLIMSQVFPYDLQTTPERVQLYLDLLQAGGFIEQYGEVEKYVRILNWAKHQRVDNPKPSKHPDPHKTRPKRPLKNIHQKAQKFTIFLTDSWNVLLSRGFQESSHLDQGSGIRDQGEIDKSILSSKPDETAKKINDILDHWATAWQKNTNLLKGAAQQERRAKIRARLNAGYSVDEIKNAITGYTFSPHHNGTNGKRYDDLVTLLRNNTQVDKGLDWYNQSVAAVNVSTDDYIDQVLRGQA